MRNLSLVIMLLLLCVVAGRVLAAGPDHVTLTWAENPATTMTITWRAPSMTSAGVVRYQPGDALTAAALQVAATPTTLATEPQSTRIYSATLTGLTPNTRYAYRVGDSKAWSPLRAFTTADPKAKTVKFLVFGDSQSIPPYTTWRTTVQQAYRAHPDARFMVNVGDLVDTGESMPQWHAWFAAGEGVIDTIPVLPVLGNHETYPFTRTGWRNYWNAQWRLPQNGPAEAKNRAYSVTVGPLHLAILDSQQGEQRRYGDILTPQQRWLDADLAAATAPWKLAFLHKGPYALHRGDNAEIKAAFCPTLEKHQVAVAFSAHDHGVARTYPLKNHARAAQGTVYVTTGRTGTKTYRDLKAHPLHAFFHNPLEQPNYLVVKASSTQLTVETFNQDGTAIDCFTLQKP